MCSYAPPSAKGFEEYEKIIVEMANVLHEGCWEGAKCFFIAGFFNIELGLLCTVQDEDEEMQGMYGPQCWHGCDGDPGGLKKTTYEVMKEFNCKAVSARS